jgi:hypothetical protein
MSSVFGSTFHCEQELQFNEELQELWCVLVMNSWKDTCELQQQKLNLILKDWIAMKFQ